MTTSDTKTTILATVGTSIVDRYASRGHERLVEELAGSFPDGRPEELGAALEQGLLRWEQRVADPDSLEARFEAAVGRTARARGEISAELDTILRLPHQRDIGRVALLGAENARGALATLLLARAVQAVQPGAEVDARLVPGFDVDRPDRLDNLGCHRLIHMASEILEGPSNQAVAVVTGGYKAMVSYITLVALVYGARVAYLYEGGREVHVLPPGLRFAPDIALWRDTFPLFERLAHAEDGLDEEELERHVDRPDIRRRVESWIHPRDGRVYLAPVGRLLVLAARRVYQDALTGLWNKGCYTEVIGPRLRDDRTGVGTIVMLDLDRFKCINDTHGHLVGNEVLRELARRMQRGLPPGMYAIRWGGEEFLLAGHVEDRDRAAEAARRVWQAIREEPFATADGPLEVTASLGVAFVRDGESWLSSEGGGGPIKRADALAYEAKRAGRDRVKIEDIPA